MRHKSNGNFFSENLTRLMKNSNMKQKDLAKALGTNKSNVCNWCAGNTVPNMDTMKKIADYFNVANSDLTDDHSSASPDEVFSDVCAKLEELDTRFRDIVIDYYNQSKERKELFCSFYEQFILQKKDRN